MSQFISIPVSIHGDSPHVFEEEIGDVDKSIDSIIDLIVFTAKGTFSADPEFGFEYWNHEFSNINVREFNNSHIGVLSSSSSLNDISRKKCEISLKESLMTYEPRLLNPEVKIELEINEKVRAKKSQPKYEMRISINGSIDDGLGILRQYEKRIAFMVEPTARKINI